MRFDAQQMIDDRDVEIIVVCGSGGVGKTSLSAALAVRAAEQGRRVVVLTIDPARRLAQSLGLQELDNTPRPVAGIDESAGGSLHAMMLDMKRTFDEVVESHASAATARQILDNPFYQALSTSFSGTQEYMAMEKLGQLHAESNRFDLIVVDTPPSRSALDFLDAPEHLSTLLDGRLIRLLTTPAKGPLRLMSAGVNLVISAMTKVLGSDLLTDVRTFVSAFETLFGGFRQRAEGTLAQLSSPQTRFVVVATGEPDALREAGYFVERLSAESMPLAGLVVNRVHDHRLELSPDRAVALADELTNQLTGPDLEETALRSHAARARIREREGRLVNRFAHTHPDVPVACVPALPNPVNDVSALRGLGEALTRPA